MTRRFPILFAAGALAALFVFPAEAMAQRYAIRARVRPVVRVAVGPSFGPYGYYSPFWYDSWYAPYYYGAYAYGQWPPYGVRYDVSSSLRLQVRPRQTEVFIDGYYAGTVDDFDGVFQRLHIEPGDHEIQLYLPGHRTHIERLYLQPTTSSRIRHDMVPLAPGDPSPVRPTGGPLAQRPEPQDPADLPPRRQGPGRGPGPGRGGEPRARGPEADAGFGSLALRVQPGDAEVLIDGERWQGAVDDRLVVQLGVGAHRVEIRKDGYRTYLTEITIRPGQTATLNVAMTRNQQ